MHINLKTTRIVNEKRPEAKLVKALYERSFPKIERVAFSLVLKCAGTDRAELFSYSDGGEFVGFAFVLLPGNYAYLLFCATKPELRRRGYGSAMLKKLRRRYPDRALVLDIEPMSESAPNSEQRLRRYMFYKNNGFIDTGYEMRDVTGEYRILSDGGDLDLSAFVESYDILPEIFEGTQIFRDGEKEAVRL